LEIGDGAQLHPSVVFMPTDRRGVSRPIRIGARVAIGAYSVLHGGVEIDTGAEAGQHCIVGEPEHGYALRHHRPGDGGSTRIGAGAVLRAGAVVYAAVQIGARTMIGHHTLLRTGVTVGTDSQLGHHMTIERGTTIGAGVRCSPGSHLTAQMHVGDRAFIGAGVRTVNDKYLIWRDPRRQLPLRPPRVESAAKIGTGAVLLPGVVIGSGALVGAGSVVTRDVAPGAVVCGVPARADRTRP
jgi:acetyltransferase-like isoleucine patch superfamily enzyme